MVGEIIKYKFKPNTASLAVAIAVLAACAVAIIFCVLAIIRAQLAVDYFSNIFLLAVNGLIAFGVAIYLLRSGYKFTSGGIVVQTAFFSDPIKYEEIKKIYYFATEDELYIELYRESNIIKINIHKRDIVGFTQELKNRIPNVPYEVSLRMDSDIE